MNILAKVKDFIVQKALFTKHDRLIVAVSGGVDSVVLVDMLLQLGYHFEIAHCNFQLRGAESKRDEAFVKELAANAGLSCHIKEFDTIAYMEQHGVNVQIAARQLRYDWFATLLDSNSPGKASYLLTAHHMDDSVETMLHHLMQGTGIAGMHGILPKNEHIVRPLLCISREDIMSYCADRNLSFVEDSSNAKSDYRRNFIRNELLPLMQQQYAEVKTNLARSLQQLSEAEVLYNMQVTAIKKKLLKQHDNEIHIPIRLLLQQPVVKTILWEIIKHYNFSAHQINDVLSLTKAEGSKYVASTTHHIIKHGLHLKIAAINSTANHTYIIEKDTAQIEFENAILSITKLDGAVIKNGEQYACIDADKLEYPLILRRRKEGDYFYPLGLAKKKKVARFLIDAKLSATEKQKVWVLESNSRIVWLVGMRIDDRFKVNVNKTNSQTVLFTLKRN